MDFKDPQRHRHEAGTDLNIFNTFCDNSNGMDAMFHNQVGWWVFSFPVISCFRHFISCQDWVRSKCGEGYSRKSGVVGRVRKPKDRQGQGVPKLIIFWNML